MILTDAQLEEIEKRTLLATKGPWELISQTKISRCGTYWACIGEVHNPRPTKNPDDSLTRGEPADYRNPRFEEACDNAKFIAHARQDIPALLDTIRHLKEENTELHKNLSAILGDRLENMSDFKYMDLSHDQLRQAVNFWKARKPG